MVLMMGLIVLFVNSLVLYKSILFKAYCFCVGAIALGKRVLWASRVLFFDVMTLM